MTRLLTERLLEAADRVPPLAAHDLRALLEVAADTISRLEEELVASRDELVGERKEPAPEMAPWEELDYRKMTRKEMAIYIGQQNFKMTHLQARASYLRGIAMAALAARRKQEDGP